MIDGEVQDQSLSDEDEDHQRFLMNKTPSQDLFYQN